VNFEFSAEELALQVQGRRFFQAQSVLSLNREMLDGRGEAQASKLWLQVAELGWPAAAIPEAYGGFGFGRVALCAIAEEVGRAAAPLPLMPSIYLAAEALLIAGSEAQKQRWLPMLASGETIGTFALAGRFSVRNGRVSGEVSPIPQALAAGMAIVSASGDVSESGLYTVDLTREGVARTRVFTIDDSQPHARLRLSSVPCDRLGTADEAQSIIEEVKRRAAVLLAFEQVGGAEACLDMAVAYARERRSFAKVIASYQVIKHRLADMYIKKELARSNAYYGAWALAKEAPELELAATTARVCAIDAYEFAAAENIQIHGGIGFTWEADCQIHYRRSRLWAHALGVTAEWQERLITAVDKQKIA
jgi:acyl-CoA dehydrogenase